MTGEVGEVSDVAARYAAAADNFTRVVRGVRDWDAPTPVAEWAARDVVGHLVAWVPGMVGGGSGVSFAGVEEAPGEDPVAAWAALDARLREILADPVLAGATHRKPHTGEAPVSAVLDRFVTPDVVCHTWDLARSSGQEPRLDEGFLAQAHAGMAAMGAALRDSGQFGTPQPEPPGASVEERFFAFIGRDPRWRP